MGMGVVHGKTGYKPPFQVQGRAGSDDQCFNRTSDSATMLMGVCREEVKNDALGAVRRADDYRELPKN
jgi:hypothetical protein